MMSHVVVDTRQDEVKAPARESDRALFSDTESGADLNEPDDEFDVNI